MSGNYLSASKNLTNNLKKNISFTDYDSFIKALRDNNLVTNEDFYTFMAKLRPYCPIIKAIEIDLEYTKRISDLMMKHNDKFIEGLITGVAYTIPQSALDERNMLKSECNSKIAELGITDYTYRQSVPKLAKF